MVSLPSAARFRSSFILPFRGPSAVSFSAAFLLMVFFFVACLLVCTSRVRIWDLIPFRWRPALSCHLGNRFPMVLYFRAVLAVPVWDGNPTVFLKPSHLSRRTPILLPNLTDPCTCSERR